MQVDQRITQLARPADKRITEERLDPARLRRTVDALVTVAGCRRKEARERIRAFQLSGSPISDLEAYLRQTYRLDPTGVEAVRNVSRGAA